MKPGPRNLAIYQGDSFAETYRIRPKFADGTLDTPYDLTGWTGKAQIRDAASSTANKLADLTVTIPSQAGAGLGTVTVSTTPTITSALTVTTGNTVYYWDLELTNPAGFKRTYLKGTVTVEAQITV